MTRRLRFAALAAAVALALSACANNDAKESDVVNAMQDAGLETEQAECIGAQMDAEFGEDQGLFNDVASAVDTDDFPEGDSADYPDGTGPVIEAILAECIDDGARHRVVEFDLIEHIAIALEHLERVPAQTKNLVAIGRLQEAPQRLGVKGVRSDDQLGHGLGDPDGVKHIQSAKHGQTIERVVPEIRVVREGPEGLQQLSRLGLRVVPSQRRFQLFQQVPKADRVLLVVGMAPVSPLVQREKRRFPVRRKPGKHVCGQSLDR